MQIKGRGSGFMEHGSGQESDEPMYLHVAYVELPAFSFRRGKFSQHHSGPDPVEVQRAKELCEDLLANVKEQYQRFKDNPPQQRGYGSGSYGQGDRQGYGSYSGGYGGGYGTPASSAQSPGVQAPPGTPGAPGAGNSMADYGAQYAQYYGQSGQDPYAQYGGYAGYVAAYQCE